MLAALIVLLIVASLVGLIVFAVRKSRALTRDADAALAAFADVVGAPFDTTRRAFRGTLDGRAVTVAEAAQGSGGDYTYFVRITVALSAPLTLELLEQRGGFLAAAVEKIQVGDAAFDKWFILRSSDPDSVRAALTQQQRTRFVEWLRTGWLWEVRVADGQLKFAGGRGLFRKDQIEKTLTILHTLVEFAAALEQRQ